MGTSLIHLMVVMCFDFSRQGEKRREKARGSSQAKCVNEEDEDDNSIPSYQ